MHRFRHQFGLNLFNKRNWRCIQKYNAFHQSWRWRHWGWKNSFLKHLIIIFTISIMRLYRNIINLVINQYSNHLNQAASQPACRCLSTEDNNIPAGRRQSSLSWQTELQYFLCNPVRNTNLLHISSLTEIGLPLGRKRESWLGIDCVPASAGWLWEQRAATV